MTLPRLLYFGTGATSSAVDVAFDASADPGMLQRAEWIKYVAAFFNREVRGGGDGAPRGPAGDRRIDALTNPD